jgi:hypothetical protein
VHTYAVRRYGEKGQDEVMRRCECRLGEMNDGSLGLTSVLWDIDFTVESPFQPTS